MSYKGRNWTLKQVCSNTVYTILYHTFYCMVSARSTRIDKVKHYVATDASILPTYVVIHIVS